MLKLCRVTKVKVLFLVLVYVFNFNLFEFSASILEKGLLGQLVLIATNATIKLFFAEVLAPQSVWFHNLRVAAKSVHTSSLVRCMVLYITSFVFVIVRLFLVSRLR